MKTKYKRIPFNLKLAKKITNKEIKGHIITRDRCRARIICFDRKETDDIFDPTKNIIALVENKEGSEGVYAFRTDGTFLLAMDSLSEEEKQRRGIKQILSCAYTDHSGILCANYAGRSAYSYLDYGAILCFNSQEAALYAAKQFEDLFF